MMSIYSYIVEVTIKLFKDDFFVVGNSFDWCLKYLAEELKTCLECVLLVNWEK